MIPRYRGEGGTPLHRAIFPFRKLAASLHFFFFSLPSPSPMPYAELWSARKPIRVSPSADTARLGEAGRGHELIIIETSRDWAHVQAILSEPHRERDTEEEVEGKTISGWVSAKALVTNATPNGDKIIFGEAADSEDQASRRRGRRDAAQDALRLYYRIYDLFPTSPLAAEGLYRAADIRWQVERSDVLTRPSAREKDATCAARSMKNG